MAVKRQGALTEADVLHYKKELARPGAITAAFNYYRALGRAVAYGQPAGISAALRRSITCPTLLVWASEDGALGPQLLRGTGRYVDNLTQVELTGCSHWMQQDQPEELNAAIKEFLTLGKGGPASEEGR